MKFINLTLLVLAGSFVSSRAVEEKRTLNDKQQCDGSLCYWISGPNGGTATLVGFDSSNKKQSQKTLNIPYSVKFEKYTYLVDSVLESAFSGNRELQEVNVSSSIKTLNVSHRTFAECPNLTRVVFNNQKVTASNLYAFYNPNKNIAFLGRGVKSYTDDQTDKLIFDWNIDVQNFSKIDDYHRKVALFNLGKRLVRYLSNSSAKDAGNAITAIKTRAANSAGYARLFRLLAIAMGYPSKEILVAHDGNGNYFNYVKLDGYWYNISVKDIPYDKYQEYYEAEWQYPPFVDMKTQKKRLNTKADPSNWYVMFSNYGYSDEFRGQQSYDKFDQYLKKNNLGSHK